MDKWPSLCPDVCAGVGCFVCPALILRFTRAFQGCSISVRLRRLPVGMISRYMWVRIREAARHVTQCDSRLAWISSSAVVTLSRSYRSSVGISGRRQCRFIYCNAFSNRPLLLSRFLSCTITLPKILPLLAWRGHLSRREDNQHMSCS